MRSVRLVLLSCLLLAGCRTNKRYDLIEAELRTRDRELRETRAELDHSRLINRAFEQQIQGPAGDNSAPVWSAAGRASVAPGLVIKDVQLGRGTGGYDEDDCPGDEALMVVVVPRDEDGAAVKVPARLTVAAWEVNSQGLKRPIGNWDIPAEKLRPLWKSGLLSTGYSVTLPWQTFPSSDRLRVAVRLTTLDGRPYEADRDVSVRPLPPQRRGPSPDAELPPQGALIPAPAQGVPVLPPVQGYPVDPPKREVVPPGPTPPGVAPTVPSGRGRSPVPPGLEELPPPAGVR